MESSDGRILRAPAETPSRPRLVCRRARERAEPQGQGWRSQLRCSGGVNEERKRSKSVPLLSKTEAEEVLEQEQLLLEAGKSWRRAGGRSVRGMTHPSPRHIVKGCAEARRLMVYSLWNNEWKWSSMVQYPVGRLPGYARDCRKLEILDDLQEHHVCKFNLVYWEAPQREVPSDSHWF